MVTDCKTSGPPAAVMMMAHCTRLSECSVDVVMSLNPEPVLRRQFVPPSGARTPSAS